MRWINFFWLSSFVVTNLWRCLKAKNRDEFGVRAHIHTYTSPKNLTDKNYPTCFILSREKERSEPQKRAKLRKTYLDNFALFLLLEPHAWEAEWASSSDGSGWSSIWGETVRVESSCRSGRVYSPPWQLQLGGVLLNLQQHVVDKVPWASQSILGLVCRVCLVTCSSRVGSGATKPWVNGRHAKLVQLSYYSSQGREKESGAVTISVRAISITPHSSHSSEEISEASHPSEEVAEASHASHSSKPAEPKVLGLKRRKKIITNSSALTVNKLKTGKYIVLKLTIFDIF